MTTTTRSVTVAVGAALLLSGCGSSASPVTLTDVPDDPMAMTDACADLIGDAADVSEDLGFNGETVWEGRHGDIRNGRMGLGECGLAVVGSDNEDLFEVSFTGTEGGDLRAPFGEDLYVTASFDPDFIGTPSLDMREKVQERLEAAAEAATL